MIFIRLSSDSGGLIVLSAVFYLHYLDSNLQYGRSGAPSKAYQSLASGYGTKN